MSRFSVFATVAAMALLSADAFVALITVKSAGSQLLIEAAPTATTEAQIKTSKSLSPMFEYLKFDKTPTFDVVAKTKDYIEKITKAGPGSYEEIFFDKDYVLRGPVIGPINRADLARSQKGLGLLNAFDTQIETFGYTIDPENPYRCFYFQRWRAVMNRDMDAYGDIYPANFQEAEMPVSVFFLSCLDTTRKNHL